MRRWPLPLTMLSICLLLCVLSFPDRLPKLLLSILQDVLELLAEVAVQAPLLGHGLKAGRGRQGQLQGEGCSLSLLGHALKAGRGRQRQVK